MKKIKEEKVFYSDTLSGEEYHVIRVSLYFQRLFSFRIYRQQIEIANVGQGF